MPEDPTLTEMVELIAAAAADPVRSESDGQSVEDRTLKDRVEAFKFIQAAKSRRGTPWGRVRMARAVPPGADPR